MAQQETLQENAENYLTSLIADNVPAVNGRIDSVTPFGELGVDSFQVLKIVKALEHDFGALPKTLMFEYFNVHDLAEYFVDKHGEMMLKVYATGRKGSAITDIKGAVLSTAIYENSQTKDNPVGNKCSDAFAEPILLSASDIHQYPELDGIVQSLYARYKNESSVSRGTKSIAPNLFIGSKRKGYFNYARSNNIVLAYAYTGPEDYFDELASEIFKHCTSRQLEFNLLVDSPLERVGETTFSATPFGAMQRVRNIEKFTLQGSRMRRLRYLVSKFANTGNCVTKEYHLDQGKVVREEIVQIIDRWCGERTMINPLVEVTKTEIIAGSFNREHRIFLTYLDDNLQNVIIISPLSKAVNGYLMDLEFYPPDMPLGGLEFAIVNIITILVKEGCGMLSLGATLGPKLAASPNADLAVDQVLDDLRQENVFNDGGNLQFKNKFRPENKSIYLCREAGVSNPDNVIDIILMIADPDKMRSSDQENFNYPPLAQVNDSVNGRKLIASVKRDEIEPDYLQSTAVTSLGNTKNPASADIRQELLAKCGYNPLNLSGKEVELDLKTDSWAELQMPFLTKDLQLGHGQFQQAPNLNACLKRLFPFDYFTTTASGREAENIFYKSWMQKGVIVENLLFPTTIYHQIEHGFTPKELPCQDVFEVDSRETFKGNLNWCALEDYLRSDGDQVAMVCVELCNNAAGGMPVSMAHLKKLRSLLDRLGIPLVIDGTRIIENALFIAKAETGYELWDIWDLVREILSTANAMVASLTKDFGVIKGGLIATNDKNLFAKLQQNLIEVGEGIDVIDKKLLAVAMDNKIALVNRASKRMAWVNSIWETLDQSGVPVVRPVGGHCVLIDVSKISEFQQFKYPLASFTAWLYLNTGIRAAAHNTGMQKGTSLNNCVRLAIPIGLKSENVQRVISRLVSLFNQKYNIPELIPIENALHTPGGINSEYRLLALHSATRSEHAAENRVDASHRNAHFSSDSPTDQKSVNALTGQNKKANVIDVAIVGLAGRYPKAKSWRELWDNLKQGRDCISDMPEDRFDKRLKTAFSRRYRGGFIDDIDKFDATFFNISPLEAELLDPQERLFLEVVWELLEDAGYYPETLVPKNAPRDVGVYVGAVWAMYQILGVEQKMLGSNVSPNSFLWSIANRISYFMNFSGPSLTLDTACSSSLTALYLAYEAIQNQQISVAVVGGVNLDLHQSKLDINTAGGTQSPDGVCRSFGRGANGYVAGEGVGALLLKPLDAAINDRDNIYGVIKSIAVNHGGKTSGYAVPSPRAQSRLISSTLNRAGIDARSIGYVEAHGTGTELGDPIEVAGLTSAFADWSVNPQSCAIGSLKSNIGHLEAAAGVVSVSKALLQLKHRQLVPSLHSSQLNEHIDFPSTPFYVVQKLEEWRRNTIDGIESPLRAGVSSFGAGGSNAHLVLEEYVQPVLSHQGGVADSDLIIPLSARNDDQLMQLATRLRGYLQEANVDTGGGEPGLLANIAYTLQLGRKSLEQRVAIIANSAKELLERLNLFIAGKKADGIVTGNVNNAKGFTDLLDSSDKEAFIQLVAQRKDAPSIAKMWADGVLGDWQVFREQLKGRRISLPTYPFADRRHWIGPTDGEGYALASKSSRIHPLIDANASTFRRQIFKKRFTDGEFFIYDHRVSGIQTLPGVAYLELARKAGELASGRIVRKIKNIVWVSPITVENSQPTEAEIELKPNGESVHFEVSQRLATGGKRLACQGKLVYASPVELTTTADYIDLEGIKSRCAKVIAGAQAYPLFNTLGLNLGPSFQVLRDVYRSDSETLGSLQIPGVRQGDFGDYVLHPSIVDGAFQAGMGAAVGAELDEMFIPYSIGEVEILHPLSETCYSYITAVDDARKSKANLAKSNVLIVDDTGKVLVKITESIGVPLVQVHEKPETKNPDEEFSVLYYTPNWVKSPLAVGENINLAKNVMLLFESGSKIYDYYVKNKGTEPVEIILVEPGASFQKLSCNHYKVDPKNSENFNQLLSELKDNQPSINRVCYAWPLAPTKCDEANLKLTLEIGIYALLYLSKALIHVHLADELKMIYLYQKNDSSNYPANEAVSGFAKTLKIEHPRISCQPVEIQNSHLNSSDIMDIIERELRSNSKSMETVRYFGQDRYTSKLVAVELDGEDSEDSKKSMITANLKEKGIYLITGGAGGLGLIFAEYLARQYGARLALTGRSPLSDSITSKVDKLKSLGADVIYLMADIAKKSDVQRLIELTKATFGGINGIIHSAGILRDSFINNKTKEDMDAVVSAKIFGTVYLDELTAEEEIDFFVAFSSMAAVSGNIGQGDYAYANHFMDSYMKTRESLVASGGRYGKSLSLNWSIWADGGMKLDEQTAFFFRNNLGIKPLTKEVGTIAFNRTLSSPLLQCVVVEAEREKMEIAWGIREKSSRSDEKMSEKMPESSADMQSDGSLEELADLVQDALCQMVTTILKIEPDDIDLDRILLDIGFDSIGLATFANAINAQYQLDITPVLFFEYPSIRAVAEHLAIEYRHHVEKEHLGTGSAKNTDNAQTKNSPAKLSNLNSSMDTEDNEDFFNLTGIDKGWKSEPPFLISEQKNASTSRRFVNCPIAIVGMSCVMPQSSNVDEYWNLLGGEKSGITEIPADRWNWRDYFGDPLSGGNKSNSKWGGFMKEIDKFDPSFFGISRAEAEMMDPQQRIFLENVWKAVEDSGQKVSDLSGTKTGLFVGVATHDYTEHLNDNKIEINAFTAAGNTHSMLANRVSYLLNLRGPSAPLDTACSSSLVALHRAIESIHIGTSDMAIVGGVQLILSPAGYISFGITGMLSPDGTCRTFDKDANGYVRGEGVGAIFIKPLWAAEQDGNPIYAVVKGTAENNGGRTSMLTVPNSAAQTDVLVEAYQKADIDPTTVGYIECHGTATNLADPVEIKALKNAFSELYRQHGKQMPASPHIGLSSVKGNIGHLETGAGIAGIIKVLLAIKHRKIPPILHFNELNPYISLENSPLYVVNKIKPWQAIKTDGGSLLPLRAGVSAFGFGGANVHIVLEEYVVAERRAEVDHNGPFVIVLSAKNNDRLKDYAQRMLLWLERNSEVDMAEFAYTLQVGRDEMASRLAFVAADKDACRLGLADFVNGHTAEGNIYLSQTSGKTRKSNADQALVTQLIADGTMEKLAEYWSNGGEIDWGLLYGDYPPSRISLPTYPFAREHYWAVAKQSKVEAKKLPEVALD